MTIELVVQGITVGEIRKLADKHAIAMETSNRHGGSRAPEAGSAVTYLVQVLPHAVVLAGLLTAWKWRVSGDRVEWSLEESEDDKGNRTKKITFSSNTRSAESEGSSIEDLESFVEKANSIGVSTEDLENAPGYSDLEKTLSGDQ